MSLVPTMVSSTKRTPRSTSRRATKHWRVGGRGVNLGVEPVELFCGFGFPSGVHEFRNRPLHSIGDLVILDRSFDLRVSVNFGKESPVQIIDQRDALALQTVGLARPNVVERLFLLGIDE